MDLFNELLHAVWQQDFKILFELRMVWTIYLLVFIILFLENSLLLTAFLPGDSLLILIGMLIAKGTLNFSLVLLLLTVAASLGSWVSYLQGKWLKKNRLVKSWLEHLPEHYHQQAFKMFHSHGLSALFIGRFIAFVRTLLPTIAGLSNLKNFKFHFFNWMSAFLWVLMLTLLGFFLGKTPVFQRYEDNIILCFMLLPLALLTIGLISSLVVVLRSKKFNDLDHKQ